MTEATIGARIEPGASRPFPSWRLAGSILGGLVFGLLVAVAVLTVVATQLFGFRVLNVSSDSMAPALNTGDVIVVKPAAIDSIDSGDIVLFEGGGDSVLTVHRVVARNEVVTNVTSRSTGDRTTSTEYRLITQGDANPIPDAGEVTAAQLHGQVWFSLPNPLAAVGIPIPALLLGLAALSGLSWLAWEVAHRRRTTTPENPA